MDNTTYVALSQLTALERQLDVTANNLANANSNGFRAERVLFESYLHPDGGTDFSQGTNFVLDKGSYVDQTQGALVLTDNPLDVALNGEGWFGYRTADGGTAYGRDGRFLLDDQGRLMTLAGAQVLDAGGAPIALPPDVAAALDIAEDGTMSTVDGGVIGRLGVFELRDLQSYERIGGGMLVPPQGQAADVVPDTTTRFVQGSVEASNVNAVAEVTRLMQMQQAYQRAVNLVNSDDELTKNLLGRLGRPA
ncbi:MAG: flagellar hook-basal body complex protein [Pseudooceanicola nanhaiensis]|jgi:flagellar basal-body rod protein FlgF|uniref:flagellar hook-basal body complex protein n=1 Tax=Pseudooceanicola nanhaiensis TaxID=375761 RepID=UPI00300B356C